MGTEQAFPLNIAFIPFMAAGHMIPMIDMAKLFARRGISVTIITTPLNGVTVRASTGRSVSSGDPLHLRIITPPPSFGPHEHVSELATMQEKLSFLMSLRLLRPQLEEALLEIRPDAVVADAFFPWTSAMARDVLGVPCFVFSGSNLFSLCVSHSLRKNKPLESSPEDSVSFVIPDLPHRIELLKTQVMDPSKLPPPVAQLLIQDVHEAQSESSGVILNSFEELESDYVKYFKDQTGIPTWFVGPVSLCNTDDTDLLTRGNSKTMDNLGLLKWLDSKAPGSVLYICFGSMINFSRAQLLEITMALMSIRHPFIWVVRLNDESSRQVVDGLEQKVLDGDGMVITEWAPQVMILDHVAVGGFVTHCGWNSCLEGIAAGVPMVTWPLFADQFNNERMLVDVLRVGVEVGYKSYTLTDDGIVLGRNEIVKAVERVMDGGEEAKETKERVRVLSEKARNTMEKGGSSYKDMSRLIEKLGGVAIW